MRSQTFRKQLPFDTEQFEADMSVHKQIHVTRFELDVRIAAGQLEAMPTGFNRMIPRTEVERLWWTRGIG